MRCFSLPATLAALVFLWGRFPARPCWSVTVALEPRWSLCPESCEASSVCQRGLGSHDGSPVDTMPGSRPDGVPSSTLINLIPINLRDRALLCHLRLFCEGGQNPPGPRANVTGMNQLLMCVIGANDFSFFATDEQRNVGQPLAISGAGAGMCFLQRSRVAKCHGNADGIWQRCLKRNKTTNHVNSYFSAPTNYSL